MKAKEWTDDEHDAKSETAKKYADLGVHRLIVMPRARDEAGILKIVSEAEKALVGKV